MKNLNNLIIPKEEIASIPLIGARFAGERAVITQGEARRKAPNQNPFLQASLSNIEDKPIGKSVLGTSVWSDITFGSITYFDNQNNQVTTPKMTFQAILIDCVFPRTIVKTEIQGRNGTVKEYIGEGDAQITFRGVITGSNGHYPIDDVMKLKQIIKAPWPIPVFCTYLNNLDINTIVFEDRNLSQEEGGYSYQTFSLNAISDTPQELQIQ